MQKQIYNIGRERATLRKKNQKEIPENKHIVTNLKCAFNKLISRLDMTEKRISELQNKFTKSSQAEMQKKKFQNK